MPAENTPERVIDRLLLALAEQHRESADPTLPTSVAEAFADLSREESRLLFGQAGELLHYGAGDAPLRHLVRAICTVARDAAATSAAIRPGDDVRLVGAPDRIGGYSHEWLSRTTFVVRHVGDDGTVDLQPDPTEDFVILTVAVEHVRPVRA